MIDQESHPGVLAEMLHTSSSSSSDDSSDNNSDISTGSNSTMKRIKRALRTRRRRKSSVISKDASVLSVPSFVRTASTASHAIETPPLSEAYGALLVPKKTEIETACSHDRPDASKPLDPLRPSLSAFKSRDFEPSQDNIASQNFQGRIQSKRSRRRKNEEGGKPRDYSRDFWDSEQAASLKSPSIYEEEPLAQRIRYTNSITDRIATLA
jgi:Ca2+:H+ antiporter